MLVTLSELQSRIETVRRHIGDRSQLAVVRIQINGQWIEATRDQFVVEDNGAIIIKAQLHTLVVDCTVDKNDASDDADVKPTTTPAWKAAFERFRKNQYTDYESGTMFNFSRQRMRDAVEVAAAAEEAIECGCRWESLAAAQNEVIIKMQEELKKLRNLSHFGVI